MIRHSPSFSLVDRSASVGEAAVAALPQALELVAPHRAQPGVIAFADQAQVLSPPGSEFTGELPAAAIPPWGTNLAAALELALALLPPGPGELLLLSDGRATAGDTLAALARARSRGVPVHVLPVGRSDPVRLVEFSGPARIPTGEVRLAVVVSAAQAMEAELILARDGEELSRQRLSLPAGLTRVEVADRPPGEGVYRYEVRLAGVEDPVPENDILYHTLVVGAPPPALLVGPTPSRRLWPRRWR